jgi:hypothetical protein
MPWSFHSPDDLSYRLDSETGAVSDIRFRGEPIVYGVYAAVRDRLWSTPAPRIRSSGGELSADYRHLGIPYTWTASIGVDGGGFFYRFRGECRGAFERNRIGLCLLISGDMAGRACRIRHTDGSDEISAFPGSISPHQPFLHISAIAYTKETARVAIDFHGDVFEAEDQRNWTDYSYKIYSTPLALPFPVRLQAGDRVEQEIRVRAEAAADAPARPTPSTPRRRTVHTLPRLGTTSNGPADRESRRLIDALRPDFLRLTREEASRELEQTVARVLSEHADMGAPLRLVLWGSGRPVRGLPDGLEELVTADETSGACGGRTAGGAVHGTLGFFAELNRGRPPAAAGDVISYTVSPEAHTRDRRSILDNVLGFRETLISCRKLYPEAALDIGSLDLVPAFYPAAPSRSEYLAGRRPDPRQREELALLYAFGCYCEAAAAGAASMSVAELTGAYGLANGTDRYPIARLFSDTVGLRRHGPLIVVTPPASLSAHRLYALIAVEPRPGSPAAAAANLGETEAALDLGESDLNRGDPLRLPPLSYAVLP